MKKTILILAALLATLKIQAQMPVTTEAFDTIRFEISETGKIIVNATVNEDSVPLRFLFDTGAIDNTLNINSPRAVKTIRKESLKDGKTNTATSTTVLYAAPYKTQDGLLKNRVTLK